MLFLYQEAMSVEKTCRMDSSGFTDLGCQGILQQPRSSLSLGTISCLGPLHKLLGMSLIQIKVGKQHHLGSWVLVALEDAMAQMLLRFTNCLPEWQPLPHVEAMELQGGTQHSE